MSGADDLTITRSDLVAILRLAEAAGQNYLTEYGGDHATRHVAYTERWGYLLGALGISPEEIEPPQ
ncbi:hypothetical protein [Nocardia rhizosphaerae]|uniref:Uncharacterized protein n=1 Tax=Nocardia rhizosphaerae TaxID=1691571 RepID=A0ABV8LAJ7_9NOCA